MDKRPQQTKENKTACPNNRLKWSKLHEIIVLSLNISSNMLKFITKELIKKIDELTMPIKDTKIANNPPELLD